MEQMQIQHTIGKLGRWLEEGKYAQSTVYHFKVTTDRLLEFMDAKGHRDFNTSIGLEFLKEEYSIIPGQITSGADDTRYRLVRKLSEIQLHGIPQFRKKIRTYIVPDGFRVATESFLDYRRFQGIIERNISTIRLYLERFFVYLTSQSITQISRIEAKHIHGYLLYIIGFSNQSRDHMMRAVRQFMGFCHKNGFHPEDLSPHAPIVHYDKRSRIPSAYSQEDVMKLLSLIDRANPVGKRNYAIILLIARLGLRAGDVANLQYENINWEENRVSLTQHKTGNPISLPLLEDVGLAIIDYLKFGRPKCDSPNVFVRHRPPIGAFRPGAIYSFVASYIGKAGLLEQGKKHGPHSLRHSLASRLLEENVPLPVISAILGHADTNTTATYLSIDIERLRGCALEV